MYSINFNFLNLNFHYKLIQSSVDFSLFSLNLNLSFWALPYFFFLFCFFFSPSPINHYCYFVLLLCICLNLGAKINTHVQSISLRSVLHYTYVLNFFTCHLAIEFLTVPRIVISCHSSQIFEMLVPKA